jgi:DNA-binding NtrC family response regulator
MPAHILSIDDESEIRELLRDVLTASGYRFTGVSTAVEAVRVVQSDPPALIITDLQLEESDGFELIDELKALAPKIPIILLTGVLFDPDVVKGAVSQKIAAYVEKTAPLERILQTVKKHVAA